MLKINPEFKKLIPPLTAEEFKQLETNCLEEGIRDAIITWQGFIIDGHNRYEIATRWDLSYKTIEKSFDDEIDVRIWMRNNQKGRRNLTKAWIIELELGNKEDLALKGKITQGKRNDLLSQSDKMFENILSQSDKKSIEINLYENKKNELPKHNTRKEIAKLAGVSTGMIAMSEIIKKKKPELWQKAKDGDITVKHAYEEIKKEEKKQERIEIIEKQIEDIEQGLLPELKGLFDVISVDPPWPYEGESKEITSYDPNGRRVANPYPEMSIQQIKDIQLPAMENSVLFLWTTHKFLKDSFDILEKWGFQYKATMVWDKEKIGMGTWLRMQCEFCLVAIKGKPYWNNTSYRDILREPRREHSRKPDSFFDMVKNVTLGRRLEYFSREKRDGWEIFGNDVNKF